MSVLEKIKSKGYWKVLVRPRHYRSDLISYKELTPILRKSAVDLRGWDFPHVMDESPKRYQNYIFLDTEFTFIYESWRFYQSGQFIHYCGIFSDWRKPNFNMRLPEQNARILGINDTVARYAEIFEFSSRFSRAIPESGDLEISITLQGLTDRYLVNESSPIGLRGIHKADLDVFNQAKLYSESELTAGPRELAAQAAMDLFSRFGLHATPEYIQAIQEKALRR